MLAKRIIPTILHKNGQQVKGQKFVNDRVVGHALQSARIHAMRGVDELMVLDVSATKEGREPSYELIKSLSEQNFSPLTVGGGVKTAEHVKQLLRAGADKVCIGYNSWREGVDIRALSDQFGKQCIVVSLDISGESLSDIEWAKACATALQIQGAGEVLLQCIFHDGMMSGYNLSLIDPVAWTVDIPVIVSSGCSGYEDMYNAIQAGADAVAAGALFQFTDATPKGAAEYLHNKGVEVRI